MPDLMDGEERIVYSRSSNRAYTIKRVGRAYSCSCPAWRNQSRHPDYRTCKHLQEFRGADIEAARIAPGEHPLNRPETRQVPARTPGGKALKHEVKQTVRFTVKKNKPEPPPAPSVWDKVKDDDPFGES